MVQRCAQIALADARTLQGIQRGMFVAIICITLLFQAVQAQELIIFGDSLSGSDLYSNLLPLKLNTMNGGAEFLGNFWVLIAVGADSGPRDVGGGYTKWLQGTLRRDVVGC